MRMIIIAALLAVAGCGTIGTPPDTDPKVVERIGKACMSSGLFKAVDGAVTAFVPAAALPVALVNAGVDRVCANPDRFASDATTVEWLVKQLGKAPK